MSIKLSLPSRPPDNIGELFDFYHGYVKVLYGLVQCEGALPVEMLLELNAVLDHLSRWWIYGEPESEVVEKCFGHMKRLCLDVYKIGLREARRQYDTLRGLDTSAIRNGEFDKKLNTLFAKIIDDAVEARRLEGEHNFTAFDRWHSVFMNCLYLDQAFFRHPEVSWNKKRWWYKSLPMVTLALGFLVGGVTGIVMYPYRNELVKATNYIVVVASPFVVTILTIIIGNVFSQKILDWISVRRKRRDTGRK